MSKITLLSNILDATSTLIRDFNFMCSSRNEPAYFTRKGKLGFVNLITFTLNFVKKSLQIEIDDFFKLIKSDVSITKQAFSEARQKISYKPFKALYNSTVELARAEADMDTFNGLRVSAIDGSTLALENLPELTEYFGCSGSDSTATTARISTLYDVLNEVVLDARIEKFSCGERELASKHIARLKELGISNDLIIFDRGYASAELIAQLFNNCVHFLMRVKRKFNVEIDALASEDGFIGITYNGTSYRLRVVKFALPSGEIETLITDLPQDNFKIADFKMLYFKRWPIETRYDTLKNKLQLENFTGKTVLSVFQDFYACMFLSNVATFAKYITDAEIQTDNASKKSDYEYKTNVNILIGKLKDNLILAILEPNPKKRDRAVQKVLAEIARNRTPIRTNRQFAHDKIPRKKKFYINKKSSL
ncbi:MAG: IS4 family transposase [Candidatus Moranbacteria bacterium]|nr:IS4 family transposase [Candidatus Moranbacteria bacterium]